MLFNIKKNQPLRWIAIVLISGTVLIACNNDTDDQKPAEETPVEVTTDSLPALDKTDSLSTTAPETIKN